MQRSELASCAGRPDPGDGKGCAMKGTPTTFPPEPKLWTIKGVQMWCNLPYWQQQLLAHICETGGEDERQRLKPPVTESVRSALLRRGLAAWDFGDPSLPPAKRYLRLVPTLRGFRCYKTGSSDGFPVFGSCEGAPVSPRQISDLCGLAKGYTYVDLDVGQALVVRGLARYVKDLAGRPDLHQVRITKEGRRIAQEASRPVLAAAAPITFPKLTARPSQDWLDAIRQEDALAA